MQQPPYDLLAPDSTACPMPNLLGLQLRLNVKGTRQADQVIERCEDRSPYVSIDVHRLLLLVQRSCRIPTLHRQQVGPFRG